MSKERSYSSIVPIDDNFRERAFEDAFTWQDGVPLGAEGLYVVNFYSIRHPLAAPELVEDLYFKDAGATLEAQEQPGFLLYFHDDETKNGVGSSFCIWESEAYAKQAAKQPKHMTAVRFVAESIRAGTPVYEEYTLRKYKLDRPSEHIMSFTLLDEKTFTPGIIGHIRTRKEETALSPSA